MFLALFLPLAGWITWLFTCSFSQQISYGGQLSTIDHWCLVPQGSVWRHLLHMILYTTELVHTMAWCSVNLHLQVMLTTANSVSASLWTIQQQYLPVHYWHQSLQCNACMLLGGINHPTNSCKSGMPLQSCRCTSVLLSLIMIVTASCHFYMSLHC